MSMNAGTVRVKVSKATPVTRIGTAPAIPPRAEVEAFLKGRVAS